MLCSQRPASDIDMLQSDYELRQISRGLVWIGYALDCRALAFEPLIDRPLQRVSLTGFALCKRNRDGKRQMGGDYRQPFVVLLYLTGSPLDSGQSHSHIIAESIKRIVCASGKDRLNRKFSPLRELYRKQSTHEVYVSFHLVNMHFASSHMHHFLSDDLCFFHRNHPMVWRFMQYSGWAIEDRSYYVVISESLK